MEFDYISRIKDLKKEKGINTEKLAELCDIPVGTLSKILSGVSDSVKLSNIVSICKVLGVSLDWLIFGIPENRNNYTLTEAEIEMIEDYRTLDNSGREMFRNILSLEKSRSRHNEQEVPYDNQIPRFSADVSNKEREPIILSASALSFQNSSSFRRTRMNIPLFELPVSAGTGQYLDESAGGRTISIPSNESTARADYAIRIKGDSMEPKFHNGDYLLVEKTDAVEVGELGIFTLDGNGYFKIFGGDHLKSLNPAYANILLKDYNSVFCCGRVIGKLKKSTMR